MNAELISDLEKAHALLLYHAVLTDSPTVEHEITTAMKHTKNAIEWEKDRP